MRINETLEPAALAPALDGFWRLSGTKIERLLGEYDPARGSPVFTVAGKYTSKGWTEWTEGFHYGSAFLQFDATGEARFAEQAQRLTLARMASHVSHVGVHDHGFNNLSTYGSWLRLQREGRLPADHTGRPVVPDPWRRGLRILVQRPALPFRRHPSVVPGHPGRPPPWPMPHGRKRQRPFPS